MLKKLLATILLLLIRIITFIIPLAFIIQTFTKEETLDALLDGIVTTMFENMNYETPDELIIEQYFNQEDLQEYYKHYFKEFITSYTTTGELPLLYNEEFEKIIHDAELKYETETGNPLDTTEIYQNIEQSDQQIKNMTNTNNTTFRKIITYKITTRRIIFLILIDIILILLVYFIYKDPISLANFLYRIFLAKTIFLILFTFFIRQLNKLGESYKTFVSIMTKTTDKVAFYVGMIALSMLLIKSLLSKKKVMPGINNNQVI